MTRYFVYLNEPNAIATVHRGNCSFCNYGEGIHDAKQTDGEWTEAFGADDSSDPRAAADVAWEWVEEMTPKRAYAHDCSYCGGSGLLDLGPHPGREASKR